jgi:hypothetical protein
MSDEGTFKIFGAEKLYSEANPPAFGPRTYRLPPISGGSKFRSLVAFVKVIDKSGVNVKVGLNLLHNADSGTVGVRYGGTWLITPTKLATTAGTQSPEMLGGFTDIDTHGPLGENLYLEIEIDADGGASQEWAMVEVYVVRKAI